jgi:hypothetical protein
MLARVTDEKQTCNKRLIKSGQLSFPALLIPLDAASAIHQCKMKLRKAKKVYYKTTQMSTIKFNVYSGDDSSTSTDQL